MNFPRYSASQAESSSAKSTGQAKPKPAAQNSKISRFLSTFDPILPPFGQARVIAEEPEDAYLTGGTRSLSRRLLALNVPAAVAPKAKAVRKLAGLKPVVLKPLTES